MGTQKGCRSAHPSVLNKSVSWGCLEDATPQPLCHREIASVSNIQGFGGPQSRLKGCEKEKIYVPHRDSIPESPSLQRVAVPTELFCYQLGKIKIFNILQVMRENRVRCTCRFTSLTHTTCMRSVRVRRGRNSVRCL